MLFRRSATALLRTLIALMVATLACFSAVQAKSEDRDPQTTSNESPNNVMLDSQIFLPMITMPGKPFTGHVSFQGGPAADAFLRMFWYTNGGTQQIKFSSTNTDANGNYIFPTTPYLAEGDYFYVYYSLDRNGVLAYFRCNNVTKYTVKYSCDFDITDIGLNDPPSPAMISLPYTFRWVRRPYTTDSYFWELYKSDGTTLKKALGSGPLGYTDSIFVGSFPAGIIGQEYLWTIGFTSPEGEGHSEQFYKVYFTGLGQ